MPFLKQDLIVFHLSLWACNHNVLQLVSCGDVIVKNDIFYHNRVEENILDDLLIIFKNLKVQIIMTELLPRNDDSTNKIFAFNLKLNRFLKNQRIHLIKLYDIFSINKNINQEFFSDDLHLNLQGQKLFIEQVLKTFKNSM